MKPPKSLLDPAFRYVPAAKTDVAATIRRVRREMAEQEPPRVEPPPNVVTIKREKAK